MPELLGLFKHLVTQAQAGCFEAELMTTPLGDERIYGHPLGFRVVRINEGPTSLRLHLWKGAPCEQPGFAVHDHVFDLVSHVVAGAIRQRTYRAAAALEGAHAVYRVEYAGGRSILQRSNERVELETLTDELLAQGTTYRLAAGQLHDAQREGCDTAITLVLTTTCSDAPITIGPWEGAPQLQAPRLQLDERPLRAFGLAGALAL